MIRTQSGLTHTTKPPEYWAWAWARKAEKYSQITLLIFSSIFTVRWHWHLFLFKHLEQYCCTKKKKTHHRWHLSFKLKLQICSERQLSREKFPPVLGGLYVPSRADLNLGQNIIVNPPEPQATHMVVGNIANPIKICAVGRSNARSSSTGQW